MITALWFVLRLAIFTAAVIWFLQDPGALTILWRGYQIETSVAFFVLAFAVFLLLWTWMHRFFLAVVRFPQTMRRLRAQRALERGYKSLTSGFVAIAAGDGPAARKASATTQKLIPDVPLTLLLSAQSAHLDGDAPRARRLFTDLLDHEEASFLGLRGLLAEKLKDGDTAGALVLMRQAEEKQPKRRWVLRNLMDLELRQKNWERALLLVPRLKKAGLLQAEKAASYKTALYLVQGQEAARAKDIPAANRAIYKAYRLLPDFVPAAVAWARALLAAGNRNNAEKTIMQAYVAQPHPQIISVWMDLYRDAKGVNAYDRPAAQKKWAEKLARLRPDHQESRKILQGVPAQSQFWVCQNCHDAQHDWTPVCARCQEFNTSVWQAPFATASSLAALPLVDAEWIGPPV